MKRAAMEENPSHAYLLSGAKGIGKCMVAETYAMALECTGETGARPCGMCHNCIQAMTGNHPDIIHVTHEKPALISVDEIREQVVADMAIKPYSGKYKIYLIEDADLMNPQAQNALLKTLEEPPAYGVMILMSTAPDTLLQTIRSRCVLLKLRSLKNTQIRNYLVEKLHQDPHQADLATAWAQGSLGRAVMLAESEEFRELKEETIALMKELPTMDRGTMVSRIKFLAEQKAGIKDYLEMMDTWFRDVLLFKSTEDASRLIFKEEISTIEAQASSCTYSGAEEILRSLEEARDRLKANVSPELVLDLLLLTIKENL